MPRSAPYYTQIERLGKYDKNIAVVPQRAISPAPNVVPYDTPKLPPPATKEWRPRRDLKYRTLRDF